MRSSIIKTKFWFVHSFLLIGSFCFVVLPASAQTKPIQSKNKVLIAVTCDGSKVSIFFGWEHVADLCYEDVVGSGPNRSLKLSYRTESEAREVSLPLPEYDSDYWQPFWKKDAQKLNKESSLPPTKVSYFFRTEMLDRNGSQDELIYSTCMEQVNAYQLIACAIVPREFRSDHYSADRLEIESFIEDLAGNNDDTKASLRAAIRVTAIDSQLKSEAYDQAFDEAVVLSEHRAPKSPQAAAK